LGSIRPFNEECLGVEQLEACSQASFSVELHFWYYKTTTQDAVLVLQAARAHRVKCSIIVYRGGGNCRV
jgi:hypothetical protein